MTKMILEAFGWFVLVTVGLTFAGVVIELALGTAPVSTSGTWNAFLLIKALESTIAALFVVPITMRARLGEGRRASKRRKSG